MSHDTQFERQLVRQGDCLPILQQAINEIGFALSSPSVEYHQDHVHALASCHQPNPVHRQRPSHNFVLLWFFAVLLLLLGI